ncbi:MAG: hypothetical protein VX438_11945, partial [Planctomycetota bacterium]|nr:hypothetical protein [Planctomycetota bacterium]
NPVQSQNLQAHNLLDQNSPRNNSKQQEAFEFKVTRPSMWEAHGNRSDRLPEEHSGEAENKLAAASPPSDNPVESQPIGFSNGQNTTGELNQGKPLVQAEQNHHPHALQLHNRYLVVESENGFEIIDQHALHERILYEQLREKVLAGKLETQRLLVPEPVQLSPPEAAAALEAKSDLEKIGIEIEAFGGDTLLITGYPAMLADHSPAEMLRQIIEGCIAGSKPDRRDTIDELLHMISCKAAVKFGDKLTPEEITVLLENRDLCQDSHHCPHGRPTALFFSREELDRRFKRI